MESLSLEFILAATGGRLPRECFNIKIRGVSTDTRTITEGCLYIALKGEHFDGNNFVEDAFKKGAYAAVAERPLENISRPVIIVNDTRAALLALAQAYRREYDIPVVGVTGSVGKTSTKEAVFSVLSQKYHTHKNEGNRNNEIGMPMSVFGLDRDCGAAVFEMGMSALGEISRLSRVAQPSVGIITNIGISHIGKLGSQKNILKAKLEILDGMKPGSTLILNGDDKLLCEYRQMVSGQKFPIKLRTYGISDKSGVYADNIKLSENGTEFDICYDGKRIHTKMLVPGRHNIYNALAAFCAGGELSVSPEEAVRGLAGYEPSGMRQKIIKCGGITIIEDCYNASPDSMRSGFDVLNTVRGGRGIAVLADMLELGDESQKAHEAVGHMAAQCGVDVLICYGDDSKYCCDGYTAEKPDGKCCFFSDKNELAKALLDIVKDGDTVLFKGSRGMKLEETVKMAYERWQNR